MGAGIRGDGRAHRAEADRTVSSPAETPTIPRKDASGYADRTTASCRSTSSTQPSRLKLGALSCGAAWPRRTNTHERQPRRDASLMSHRVCAAEPVIVCRKMQIGASGGSDAPTSSLHHSTTTSGSAVGEIRPDSGGSTLRRMAPRRERRVANAKLILEARTVGE